MKPSDILCALKDSPSKAWITCSRRSLQCDVIATDFHARLSAEIQAHAQLVMAKRGVNGAGLAWRSPTEMIFEIFQVQD